MIRGGMEEYGGIDKIEPMHKILIMEFNVPLKYRQDIEAAANLLKKEGCQSVFLFGSLVTGKIHDDSDIDIGIKGLPKGKFFEVYSRLYFDIESKVDLVDFDANPDFYSMLTKIGEVVQIG
jgi:predicted nucleotidyltransferase